MYNQFADIICCCHDTGGFIRADELVDFFNGYHKGFEGFYYFCHDVNAWRAPNSFMYRFNFDPMTGEKIDWNAIYEWYKEDLKDYTPELEKNMKSL